MSHQHIGDDRCSICIAPEAQMGAMIVPDFMKNTGFVVVDPHQKGNENPQFEIVGDLCQIVHINLPAGQAIQAEPGTMCYMSDGIKMSAKLGGIGRVLTGSGLFKVLLNNKKMQPGYVGLTANIPATIIPLNMDMFEGAIRCKHDAFLGALDSQAVIKASMISSASCAGMCCSGVPFFMQEIQAKGFVFIAAHGTVMCKQLLPGEEIVVDHDSVVAVSKSVTVDAKPSGSCMACCCGGEGAFITMLKGPGMIYLSSLPFEKLRRLFWTIPKSKRKKNQHNAASGNQL